MRVILTFGLLIALCGCAGDYSKVPEPTGEWVAANPPGMVAEAAPAPPARSRAAARRVVAR